MRLHFVALVASVAVACSSAGGAGPPNGSPTSSGGPGDLDPPNAERADGGGADDAGYDPGPGVDPTLVGVAPHTPLEIVFPRAAGSAPEAGAPPISPNHRIFWAYPGVAYSVGGAVAGGHAPYTYSLVNAPPGMTIQASTGEITWPNPQADAANIGFRVVDRSGVVAETTWNVDVDAAKFIFVQASAAPGGSGSRESPYRRISDIPEGSHVGKIVYFRTGIYDVLDMPRDSVGTSWDRVEFNASTKPLVWLAYPGEAPVINEGYAGAPGYVPFIRMSGEPVQIEGFEAHHGQIMTFQLGGNHYAVVRKNNMHSVGPGMNGTNAAFVMTIRGFTFQANYMVFQDNQFHGTNNTACLKFYSQYKILIERNTFYDTSNTEGGEGECLALKDSVHSFTVRKNVFYNMGATIKTIGGNMNADEVVTGGEILYNVVRAGSLDALDLNQDSVAGPIWTYRNTFVGRVRVRKVGSTDGPFFLSKNVIVNPQTGTPAGSHVFQEEVTDPSRITLDDNLIGTPTDGIVDALGNLTAAHAASRGRHGYE